MPRIITLSSDAAIYVSADDHAPPHFHVRGPQSNAQVRIDTLEVIAGTIPERTEAITYPVENRDPLMVKWSEFQ